MKIVNDPKIFEDQIQLEERYKLIINNLMDIIIILDLNGNFLYVSPQVYDISGFKQGEVIGKNGFNLMHPEDLRKAYNVLRNAIRRKRKKVALPDEKVYIEFRTLHKNGEYIDVSANGRIVNIDGEDRIIAAIRDITQQKEAERKLRESEERYRLITENANDMIAILNEKIEYEYVNEAAFHKIMGRTKDKYIGAGGLSWVHPEDREKCITVFKRGWETGEASVQARFNDEFGKYHWLEIRGRKIVDQTGEEKVLIVSRDITENKAYEQKLKESEEKFRNLFENSANILLLLDQNGIILDINQIFLNKFGYEKDELIGKDFRNISRFDPVNKLVLAEKYQEVLKKGAIEPFELETKNQLGDSVWINFQISLHDIGNKKLIQVILKDITENKLAEQKVRESEEMFRTISEQAFTGILIIQDEKVEYFNSALLNIFEFSSEEIANWRKEDIIKLIHPDDLQFLREYRDKLRTGDPEIKPYYPYRVFTKSGQLKWIDQFSKPIIYKGREAELVTIMDITDKKNAEQELIKLNTLKSELLRRTSHELKTPLVSIKGYSDLILKVHKDKLDDYIIASVREIKLGCERLESLIQDILKTSELESNNVELKKTDEDISFLIKLCVRELQGIIKLRNHTINLEIPDKLITLFESDQIHLVISNLLNNAIKYTPPNGEIHIGSTIENGFVLISIRDNGIGITDEERKILFSQFGKIERYGQGVDVISDGSGLGLYITKRIIELHGGEIWVESEGRNKGSTFYFTLPLIRPNEK